MTIISSTATGDLKNSIPQESEKSIKKAVAGVTMGNMVEWFDFALYSSMAGIIGSVFFQSGDRTTELLQTYATFAAGFLIRPLGSLVFGPIGDKFGRRTALTLSIALMAIATSCIALIPSQQSIGIWAPALLISMRLLQGLSAGGENSGSCIFISEHSPDKRRSFFTSWLEFGNVSGFLLGMAVVNLFMWGLGEEVMKDWGWRIPFVLGGLLGLIALYLRLHLDETPVFKKIREKAQLHKEKQRSLPALLMEEWPAILKCMGLTIVFNVCYYILVGYIPGYLNNELGYSDSQSSFIGMVATLALLIPIPLMGLLADWFDRRRMIILGCAILLIFPIPSFLLIQSGNLLWVYLGLFILLFGQVMFHGTMPATLPSLFRGAVRYSALALSYNVAVSVFAGTAPYLNTKLIDLTGNPMIPAWYMMAAAFIGLLAVIRVRDRTGKPMPL